MTKASPNATILFIEDDPDLREELAEELASVGYGVLTAAEGDEAEVRLCNHKPDLVLCDVMLPGRSGFDLLRDLRAEGRLTGATPFLFLTALSHREAHLEGLRAGATDYIVKPVDLDQLHLKITNLLAYVRSSRRDVTKLIDLPTARLSRRETQVLALLGRGIRTASIAHELNISEHTVNQYIKDLYRKLGLGNRADAALAALQLGLLADENSGLAP